MTVLVFERAREVRVPGAGGPVGSHECTPGSCAHQHYFANIYVCRTTGCHHVCDRTCRYRSLAPGGTVCRLTQTFFKWDEQSVLGKGERLQSEIEARGSKRSRDDIECMEY